MSDKGCFYHFSAPLWFLFGGRELVVGKAIALMRAINENGSISKAADAVPMSYRSAWDLLNKLNNVSPLPIVVKETGGSHGGGTQLSNYGKTILRMYSSLERSYEVLQHEYHGSGSIETDAVFSFIKGVCMKTSARNQLAGMVREVVKGKVNTEVTISLGEKLSIVATITNESAENLEIHPDVAVVALIKASTVLLFPGMESVRTSAENMLKGTVAAIRNGAVNSEVIINLPGEKTVTSIVTKKSVEQLGLQKGKKVCAAFGASQVILALPV